MKNLAIVALLVLAGCHRQSGGGVPSGASSAREAVEQFLTVAKAQNYDAMGRIWGTVEGPASAKWARPDLEQREFILMTCLRHDRFQILGEAPAIASKRVLTVELKLKDLTATSDFTAVQGPGGRWYVESFPPDDLRAICTASK